MKTKIYNYDNLEEKDINDTIKRVKIILINSKDEALLVFSNNSYHFVGGHVEKNETLEEAIKREIKEETGIIIPNSKMIPFYKIVQICKDYPEVGINNSYEYYYYEIKTDEKPNLDFANLTENEKNGNFELKYIKLSELEQILKDSISLNKRNKTIVGEMLEALAVYRENR